MNTQETKVTETTLQVFDSEEFGEIRTVIINEEVWFVGKDVADALGYEAARNAIKNHVNEKDKLRHQISASGQMREMTLINESGLYSLVLSSKLPNAKKFQHWVTSQVLPSIRKTGSYSICQDQQPMDDIAMFEAVNIQLGLSLKIIKEHDRKISAIEKRTAVLEDRTNKAETTAKAVFFNQEDQQVKLIAQSHRLDEHNERITAVEEKIDDRAFAYPDKKKAKKISNRMFRICEARRQQDLGSEAETVYEIPQYIEYLKEYAISSLEQTTGRNIAREVQAAQSYYLRKYFEAKAKDKSPSLDILRPAAIRNLTQISYISSDPDLYTQLMLILDSFDYGGSEDAE